MAINFRVTANLNPAPGEPLGAGKAREVNLHIRGDEPIGEVFDAGVGQYLQPIEYPRGASLSVSVAAAEMTTSEMRVPVGSTRAEGRGAEGDLQHTHLYVRRAVAGGARRHWVAGAARRAGQRRIASLGGTKGA